MFLSLLLMKAKLYIPGETCEIPLNISIDCVWFNIMIKLTQ